MRIKTETAMKYCSILLALSATYFAGCTPPNVDELDNDISELTSRLQSIDEELAGYEGGLIHRLIETRKQLASTTKEMLEQKRASLLYWIKLEYSIEGTIQEPASEDSLQKIMIEIAELESKVDAAEIVAEYSGGLIGVMKQAEVATLKLSVATLKHSYYAKKYGVPLVFNASDDGTSNNREIIDPSDL